MQTSTVRFDASGQPSDTLRASGRSAVLAVTRDTTVSDETWYRIEPSRGFAHCVFGQAAWYANRADGLYRWTTSPADAERVYGLTEGEAFLDTPVVLAVLVDEDAALDAGPARRYERTWRRLEFDSEIRGSIEPTMATTDFLSSERGPLALEVHFVRQTGDGRFQPSTTLRYEMSAGADDRRAVVSGSLPVR